MSGEAPGRALVTGATGFLGSHLARRLAGSGWELHTVVRPGSSRDRLPADAVVHVHDGTAEGMIGLVQSARPDVTFHLASRFVARHAPSDVDALVDANVRFGAQLAEGLRAAGRGVLVNAGTAWQHGGDDGDAPVSLYAATKQAFEELLGHYVRTDGFRVVTLVLFDTYGPDDPRGKVLDLLVRTAREGGSLAMSPGGQRMHLVHVDDVVDAFEEAAARLLRPAATADGNVEGVHERFRVDSDAAVSLRELAEAVEAAVGRPLDVEWGGRPYRDREIMTPWAGGRRLPGWSPRVGLGEGLAALVAARG